MARVKLVEEEYISRLKSIIEKDFFPDIEKRNLQLSFLTAYTQYFDSPMHNESSSLRHSAVALATFYNSKLPINDIQPSTPSLTLFISKNTSEDNASFEEVLESSNAKKRAKFESIYETTLNLMLESSQKSTSQISGNTTDLVLKEKFPINNTVIESVFKRPSGKNALFFNPTAQPLQHLQTKPRFSPSFKKGNTRFKNEIFDQESRIPLNEIDIEKLSSILISKIKSEYLKAERNDHVVEETSKTDFASFIPATPLLVAGETAPNIMTWGFIENTPVQLPPLTPNHAFQILPVSQREILGRKLAMGLSSESTPISLIGSSRKSLTSISSRSQRSTASLLSASPAVRRMIGASMRRMVEGQSITPNISKIGTPNELAHRDKTEWEAVTPNITQCTYKK